MSLEAISSINEAEQKARAMRAQAAADAKKEASAAHKNGEEQVAAAIKKAEAEIRELTAKADEAAKAGAEQLNTQNENKKAAMRAKAETKLSKAAELIVERIVNS